MPACGPQLSCSLVCFSVISSYCNCWLLFSVFKIHASFPGANSLCRSILSHSSVVCHLKFRLFFPFSSLYPLPFVLRRSFCSLIGHALSEGRSVCVVLSVLLCSRPLTHLRFAHLVCRLSVTLRMPTSECDHSLVADSVIVLLTSRLLLFRPCFSKFAGSYCTAPAFNARLLCCTVLCNLFFINHIFISSRLVLTPATA